MSGSVATSVGRTPSMRRCPVSECFPGSERLFEVKGFTTSGEETDEDGQPVAKEFRYLAKNVVSWRKSVSPLQLPLSDRRAEKRPKYLIRII